MRQQNPEVEFAFAQGCVVQAMVLGWFFERLGRWGKRRSYIMMYKALKRTMPAIREFSKMSTSPMGVTEGDIDNRELRKIIRNIREQTLALRHY